MVAILAMGRHETNNNQRGQMNFVLSDYIEANHLFTDSLRLRLLSYFAENPHIDNGYWWGPNTATAHQKLYYCQDVRIVKWARLTKSVVHIQSISNQSK